MEANKASNLLEHAAEIKSRPAKAWFQSEREEKRPKERPQGDGDGGDGLDG